MPLKKAIFSSDAAVQTEAVSLNFDSRPVLGNGDGHDDQESTLSAADLASILKWSKDISSDINLSSGFFHSLRCYWAYFLTINLDSLAKINRNFNWCVLEHLIVINY